MGKFFKILFAIMAVLVLLVISAVVVLPRVVNPNDFRGRISQEVEKATGRELVIGGDIGLSVFPWLGLTLNQVSLNQPEGFGDQPFAEVKKAEVRVKLLPLLERRVEADTLVLDGLRLNLIRDTQGKGNWEDLGQGETKATAEKSPVGPAEGGQALQGLSIGGVEIADAEISWDDRQTGQEMELHKISVHTGAIEPGKPLDLALAFDFHNATPALSAHLNLKGTLEEIARGERYRIASLRLSLTKIKSVGARADLDLQAGVDLDLKAQRVRVAPVKLKLHGSGGELRVKDLTADLDGRVLELDLAQGSADLSGLVLKVQTKGGELPFDSLDARLTTPVKANWKTGVLALAGLDLQGQAQGKDLPGGAVDLHLVSPLNLDWKKGTLEIPKLTLDTAGLHATGNLAGLGLNGQPAFKGRIDLAQTDLRGQLQALGVALPPMADTKALTRVALSSAFETGPKAVALSGLKIRLDDSLLQGQARILTLGKHPGYRFALKLDRIDLDRYLPPEPKTKPSASAAKAQPAPKADENAPLFELEPLRGLDVDGSLDVGHLVVRGLKFDGIHLKIKGAKGRIGLQNGIDGLYKGSLKGSAHVDASGKTARMSLKQDLRGVRAEPLVKDLLQEDRLSGQAQMHLDLRTRGQSLAAIKRGLNGELRARFTDGEIKGFNLAYALRKAAASLRGRTLPPEKGRPKTDFTELRVDSRVVSGVVKDDLRAKSPLFRVTGQGSIDLVQMTLDYKVKPVLVATLKGEGGEDLNHLKGVPIPIELEGPLTRPDWSINIAEALTESQKARLKEKASKELKKVIPKNLQDKLPGGLDEQLDGALKGLFN